MKSDRPENVAVFWYADARQYDQYLAIIEDANEMPVSFALWHKKALKLMKQLKRRGIKAIQLCSTPEELQAWCLAHNVPLTGRNRALFAQRKANGELDAPIAIGLQDEIQRLIQREDGLR